VKATERIREHYDVEEVEFGKIYKWCPEGLIVECECSQRRTVKRAELLSGLLSTCECGKYHMDGIRE
jgi:hypothetical protein